MTESPESVTSRLARMDAVMSVAWAVDEPVPLPADTAEESEDDPEPPPPPHAPRMAAAADAIAMALAPCCVKRRARRK